MLADGRHCHHVWQWFGSEMGREKKWSWRKTEREQEGERERERERNGMNMHSDTLYSRRRQILSSYMTVTGILWWMNRQKLVCTGLRLHQCLRLRLRLHLRLCSTCMHVRACTCTCARARARVRVRVCAFLWPILTSMIYYPTPWVTSSHIHAAATTYDNVWERAVSELLPPPSPLPSFPPLHCEIEMESYEYRYNLSCFYISAAATTTTLH